MIPGQRGINDMHARHPGLSPVGPVFLVDLLPGLHNQMMNLLRGLAPTDWGRPTACTLWSVKDIAAHLLDGSLRRLSFGRDRLEATPVPVPVSYAELVAYLNRLNAEWVAAARRLSSRILMDLLDSTAPQVHAFLRSLDPHAAALFPVAWAGEDSSPNWFDIGREYTERWLHQQQIREAVGAPGLTGREWLAPTLDIFMRALPFTYRDVAAATGQVVRFDIEGEAGGVWTLIRENAGWRLFTGSDGTPGARVSLGQETAWKLFSKGLTRDRARATIRIDGKQQLGEPVFSSLAVMA
jgi:uncharacterized protein (TIGR03083 family)